jgi:hypothetical protein
MKSEIAQAVQDQVFDFARTMAELKTQKNDHQRSQTVEDKRYANARLKQLQPSKPKPKKEPWNDSNNYNYLFEGELKTLPGSCLTNPQI